jgi:hypothetical protein
MHGSAVEGEQGIQEGTKYTPQTGLRVEGQRGEGVVAYRRPVRKSRIPMQRGVFSPRVFSW